MNLENKTRVIVKIEKVYVLCKMSFTTVKDFRNLSYHHSMYAVVPCVYKQLSYASFLLDHSVLDCGNTSD